MVLTFGWTCAPANLSWEQIVGEAQQGGDSAGLEQVVWSSMYIEMKWVTEIKEMHKQSDPWGFIRQKWSRSSCKVMEGL